MKPHDEMPEHEFEAAHGLPERLPDGERMLWQGAPDWRVLARQAFHLRTLAIYFAALLAWRAVTVLVDGHGALQAVQAVLWLAPLAVLALAMLALMSWLVSKTSVYTVTDQRVVMRIGVVLSITFNLPYSKIDAAGLRENADGSGDVNLLLDDQDRIAYVHLWPHARPWHVKRTQPMLRALPDVRTVAQVLSSALAASAGAVAAELPAAAPSPVASDLPETNHRPGVAAPRGAGWVVATPQGATS